MTNYMIKTMLLSLSLTLAPCVFGATVKFGDAFLEGQFLDIYFLEHGGSLYMTFDYTYGESSISIHSRPVRNLQYSVIATLAYAGDIASADYFNNLTQFLSYAEKDDFSKSHSDYDITILLDESAYIAYQVNDASYGYLYGWYQLGYPNGELTALNSAIDLDGDSIVVGAIPEPSSGLLLLLGVAGLALKRRRAK